jgi:2-methylcitrate dehydratase
MNDGRVITDEMAVANAHPLGAKPWVREDYIGKFESMTEGLIAPKEATRFLQAVQALPDLDAGELGELNVAVPPGTLAEAKPGIF